MGNFEFGGRREVADFLTVIDLHVGGDFGADACKKAWCGEDVEDVPVDKEIGVYDECPEYLFERQSYLVENRRVHLHLYRPDP